MGDDLSILLDRIGLLLDARGRDRQEDPADVELTLTDGYARALALEGELRRTEARIRELAGSREHEAEVLALKQRLELVEVEHDRLRSLLGVLSARL